MLPPLPMRKVLAVLGLLLLCVGAEQCPASERCAAALAYADIVAGKYPENHVRLEEYDTMQAACNALIEQDKPRDEVIAANQQAIAALAQRYGLTLEEANRQVNRLLRFREHEDFVRRAVARGQLDELIDLIIEQASAMYEVGVRPFLRP